ncbi:MAG TPA: hypothetical protein VF179_08880, partial [Thermoanaerobaculia bacterium]|nr:hypothetical protein [Thermoanaerobaculia bacterium]
MLELLHQLPVLPPVSTESLSPLVEDLRSLIFPRRSRIRKGATQDNSDLTHLALCIQQHLTGFITNEKALLRSSIDVHRKYGLEILSPYYFVEPTYGSLKWPLSIQAQFAQSKVSFDELGDSELADARELLRSLNVEDKEAQVALDPGTSGNLRRR